MAHPNNLVHQAAKRWIGLHLGEHLAADRQRLIDRGAAELRHAFRLAPEEAEREMLHALGAVESHASAAYIDIDHSTPYAVFLVDPPSGRTVAFTARDLLAISHIAGSATRPQQAPARGAQSAH